MKTCFQVIGTPIQIAGLSGQALQGVVMKQEPGETGSSQGLTITPVSLASHSQHVSVLQMGEVSDMGNKKEMQCLRTWVRNSQQLLFCRPAIKV